MSKIEKQEKGGKKIIMRSKIKIPCPFCKERFWSLAMFYAHMENCEERKKWENEKPCWETDLRRK